MNQPHRIQAIDVHAHYGASVDQKWDLINRFMTADAGTVESLAEHSGIQCTLVSPLAALFASEQSDVLAANRDANEMATKHKGLFHWVVVNPLMPETFAQARELMESPRCVGVKIHPEQHGYKIGDHGEAIFAFAAEQGSVVQSHSGCVNSEPKDFVPFANRFPEMRLIISHLGHHWDGDVTQQVRAVEKSKHQNVFTDTSSTNSIIPNLIEWAVSEIGSERILFGTDSPLYFAPMQRARIDGALIREAEKLSILRDNTLRLFFGRIG